MGPTIDALKMTAMMAVISTRSKKMEKYGVVNGEKEPVKESLEEILERQKKRNKENVSGKGPGPKKGPTKHRVKSG